MAVPGGTPVGSGGRAAATRAADVYANPAMSPAGASKGGAGGAGGQAGKGFTPTAGVTNAYAQGANAQNNAYGVLESALGMNFGKAQDGAMGPAVTGSSYNPMMIGQVSGYNPSAYQADTFTAAKSTKPQDIAAGIDKYMNPYEQDVVDTSMRDIERMRRMGLEQVAGDAASAGAFGGSRHGLVEAETNRAALDTMASTSAGLRQSGWETAADLAGRDVSNTMANNQFNAGQIQQSRMFNSNATNAQKQQFAQMKTEANRYLAEAENLARSGNQNAANEARAMAAQLEQQANTFSAQFGADQFNDYFDRALAGSTALSGMGQQTFNNARSITSDQMQQGTVAQQMTQAILNAGSGMMDSYLGSPANILNLRLGALGMTPGANKGTTNSTTSYDPGAAGVLSGITGVLGAGKGGKGE